MGLNPRDTSEELQADVRNPDRDAFAEARLRTLRDALAMTAEGRVHLAESLWAELSGLLPPQRRGFAISFDTFEEYHAWQEAERRR
jgi:hypothetical protein